MEGDLQPLYLLLTDCYIYLLRKGKNMQWLLFMYLFLEVQFVTVLVCTHIRVIGQTYLRWSCVAGAADKPYNVEDAVSYNELDYLSVSFTTRPGYFFMIICRFKCLSVFILHAPIPPFCDQ